MNFRLVIVAVLLSLPLVARGQNNPPAGGGQPAPNPGGNNPGSGAAPSRTVPHDDYYAAFTPLMTGDYVTAKRAFQDVAKGGIRSIDGRWVDSICYHTMVGECFYQLGDFTNALDQYTSALKLCIAHNGWLSRVEWSSSNVVPLQVPAVPWGPSRRNVVFGRYPEKISTFQGRLDNQNVLAQGGVFQAPQLFPVNVVEILRCTTLALRRRLELMGPVAQHDALTNTLADLFGRPQVPAGHWAGAIQQVQYGLALAATGKPQASVSELQKGITAGQFEHPLSSTALLELGKLAFNAGQYEAAATSFHEASLSAAVYARAEPSYCDVIMEAFRGAVLTHIVSGQKVIYPPLAPATLWAKKNSVPLDVTLLTLASDNLLSLGETARASVLLADARRTITRREMSLGVIGARLNYETAKLQYQLGNLAAGNTALNAAIAAFQRGGSHRAFQVALTQSFFAQGILSDRVADELFTDLLREPVPTDWTIDPCATLAFETTVQTGPLQHWFELNYAREASVNKGEPSKAIEIADRLRRHRFFTNIAAAGRTQALRWVLEAPRELLSDRAALQRADLHAKYPRYAEASRQSATLRDEIRRGPLVPGDDDAANKQLAERFDKLAKLTALQEVTLNDMALNRHAADQAFPPLLDAKPLQAKLQQGQLVLAFLNTDRYLVGFALSKDKYAAWQVEAPNKLRGDIAEMLKRMGHVDRNKPFDMKELRDESWQSIAKRILPVVTNNMSEEAWGQFDELIIVPDSLLWYLPFEALPITSGDTTVPLISKVRIRYVPTVALAVPDARPARPNMRTLAVAGKLSPRDELDVSVNATTDLAKSLPGTVRLMPKPIAPSGMLAKFADRAVVYHDIDEMEKLPFDWSPLQIDKGKPGAPLQSWLALPWGGPEQLVFPGFHTVAEVALKKAGTGDEIFLSVCGLMSTGARTVMLSRWRSGGQSSYDLVREFMQELPHSSAASAWQRSVQLRQQTELDPALEPRLKLSPADEPIKPTHPFFWAGPLLVDTGFVPGQSKPSP